jgi:predicted MFS family arabinose efflux permease
MTAPPLPSPPSPDGEGAAGRALRTPAFRRFYAGAFLSNIGTWMQNVVLGALAYDLTGSSTFVGIIVFAQLGPMLVLAIVGGALVDIVDRRKLLGGVAVVQLVLSLALAAVAAPDEPNLALLVAVVFALGVAQAIYLPAYAALLPQLVGPRDLPGAISLNSVQMNASRVIGPVIGAGLDTVFGASAVFGANAVSYLFVIAAVLTVPLPRPPARERGEPVLRHVLDGLQMARRDQVVRRCLVTITTFSLVSLTFVGQFPVIAERNLGIDERSPAYGALYACLGLGGVLGALAVGTVLAGRRMTGVVRATLPAFAAVLTGFALVRDPAPAYALALALGLTYFGFITSLSTVLQERVGNEQRGRVTALWLMGFGGTVPVGNLLAGPLIEATSPTTVLLVGAVASLALAVYARLDAPPETAAGTATAPRAA